MDGFFYALLGGALPACFMLVFYFVALAARLARIETNITWIIKELKLCRPHLKNLIP